MFEVRVQLTICELIPTYFLYIVYVMSVRDFLGEFEHIVLLAVLRLGENAYGVTVRREIQTRADRDVSTGAIYATLDRLQAKGYVTSFLGDPTPERGGRSKRFFRVSAKGVAAIHNTQRALKQMTAGLRFLERYT
jgi:PadR family transcriptional regulator, regulatory protein PadR